jgi:hypothetical protein
VSTPVDPNVIATYDPNAAPGTVAHASKLRQSLADTISNFGGAGASASAAPKQAPTTGALRDLGTRIANAS